MPNFFPQLSNREQVSIVDSQNYISGSDPGLIGWASCGDRGQRHTIVTDVGITPTPEPS
jgi:hypothetical protein